jgi:hypothetical protein
VVGEQAFFQIAVGLLPVLLFGGIFVTRPRTLRPWEPRTRFERLVGESIPFLGIIAVAAEVYAITGAISATGSSRFDRLFVIAVILLAMTLIVATAAHNHRRALGARPTASARLVAIAGVTVVIGLAFTAKALNNLIEVTQEAVEIEGAGSALLGDNSTTYDEMEKAEEHIAAAERRITDLRIRLMKSLFSRPLTQADRFAIKALEGQLDLENELVLAELKKFTSLNEKTLPDSNK